MSDRELLFRDKTVFTEQGLSCRPELTEPTNKHTNKQTELWGKARGAEDRGMLWDGSELSTARQGHGGAQALSCSCHSQRWVMQEDLGTLGFSPARGGCNLLGLHPM